MVKELPVIYLQTAACSGCAVTLLNTASPTIKNVLIDQIAPGVHINLRFHPVIMAAAGEMAIRAMEDTAEQKKGEYVLVVDGAVPTAPGAVYGAIGERNGKPVTMLQRVTELAADALAVIALGTCASFGGIPAAPPNPTGCQPVRDVLKKEGISKPLVNIPGCPPHPDWFVGTVAGVILNGLPAADDLDDLLRPRAFYGKLIHENCPRRACFDEGKFARKFGDDGCLYELGCKGPITYADCPVRRWNSGTNWVIGAGAPCNGCTQPEFPDQTAPFYEKLVDVELPTIGAYWAGKEEK
ncbi:MAG TPA: hydrogenase small subunit [Dehalococcoidales bacterium]|nr:hydrogenase small subunit [Dehalococcoidales bacterium]